MKTSLHSTIPHPSRNPVKLAGWLLAAGFIGLGGIVTPAQTATVLTDHAAYYPGETIAVSFQGGPGNSKDWVGIYPDGVEPGSTASTLWYYVNGTRTATTGQTEGMIPFPNGLNLAGDWVAFLLLNDGYTKLV